MVNLVLTLEQARALVYVADIGISYLYSDRDETVPMASAAMDVLENAIASQSSTLGEQFNDQ